MEFPKIVPFKFMGRREKIFLHVALYEFGMRLAIEMFRISKDGIEPYVKLTVNQPSAPFQLNANEAYIDVSIAGKEFLAFIRKHHLGTVVPDKTFRGFPLVAFDWNKLKEFDPMGVETVEDVWRTHPLS